MSKQPISDSIYSSESLLPYAQELVNSSIQGILAFDTDCRYTIWNPAMERISGFSAKEVLGKIAFEVFPFLKQTKHDLYFYETLKGRNPVSPETPYRTPKGAEGFFEGRYFPIRNAEGEVTGGFALILDVTDRKKGEEALRQSEATLRTLFNSRAYNIILIGKDGRLLAFNEGAAKAAREVQGVEYKVGERFDHYVPEAGRAMLLERHRQILAGESQRMERPFKGVDGVEHWYDIQYDPVRDDKGEIIGICLANVCIDDKKKSEQIRQESEATLRGVFNSGPQAMVLLGLDGEVKAFNQNAVLDAGKNRGQTYEVGRPMVDYVGEKAAPGFRERFQRALKGETVRIERPLPKLDGTEQWVELTYNPVYDGGGKITGVCMTSLSIEDRRRAEQTLQKSEADLRAVFNSGSQVTVLIGRDGRVQGFNKSAERMAPRVLGREIKLGMLFTDTFPPGASLEVFHKSFAAAMEGNETRGERSIRAADGRERWVEVSYQGVFNHEGGVDGVCFSLFFIDERKNAEKSLRESEEKFRKTFQEAPLGMAVADECHMLEVNRAFCEMLGYSAPELLGKHFKDITHPEDLEIGVSAIQELRNEKINQFQIQKRYLHKNGSPVWVNVIVTRVPGPSENGSVTLTMIENITHRKMAEEVLRDSEERYRKLIEFSPEAVVVHAEGRVLYVNSSGLKMFGFSPSEVQGKSILDFIHPDYREMSISRVRQIMESGQTTEWTEQKLIRLNGKAFDAETKGTPFVYQGRQSILTIVRDVTERKKNQETLLRYERLATVGKVIAAIAHEIRNPLAMVAGMTKLLKTKLEVRKEYSQEIQTILSQTDRLGLFMNDILDYSREMEMNKTAVDARFLLEESLTAAQAQVGASHVGVDVEWKMEGVLPSFPGDKDRLQQVIINLILNAYQALGEKGVLTIFARAEKGWMRLGVKDDGPGINEVDLPRLFEPFFTTKKHGSGLGLPISQKIVEAHGGKIEVQRIQPHGTLFTLHLPLSKT